MKINIIIDQDNNDSNLDSNILQFLFKKIKDKTDIKVITYNNYKCDNASINIFCGVVNNLLLKHAKTNILIINQQEFYKTWIPFLNNFDHIIAKTRHIEKLLSQMISKKKIHYLSWRSSDLSNNYEKDFDEYLLFCYDTKFIDYKTIVENWKPSYPNLNIVNGPQFKLTKIQDNIIYHNQLNQIQFENLYNRCGIHLCLNSITSFPHNINQCCLSKSVPIICNNGPMTEIFSNDNCFYISSNKKKLNNGIGLQYKYNIDDLENVINKITKLSESTLETMGEKLRNDGLKNHNLNDSLFKDFFANIIKNVRNIKAKNNKSISDDKLPKISLITLTHNRKNFFKLAIYNYNTSTYPKNKLEWIIYDTSNQDNIVLDLLPNEEDRKKMNIKYIHNNKLITIGESRNLACEIATNEIIVFTDDDDYYYPDSIKNRVMELENSDKKIVCCSIIGSFNINKYISFIETLPLYENIGHRIYPGTLCFYKELLNKNKFDDENLYECNNFINKNINSLLEISWENILVSLVHKTNISFRKTPNTKPNGSHFKLSEQIFKFITSLDEHE
jgi:hypothetical protein